LEVGDYVTCGAAPVRHLLFNGFRLPGGLTADSICPVRRAASRPAKEPAAVFVPPSAGEGATGWARPSEGALRRRLSTLPSYVYYQVDKRSQLFGDADRQSVMRASRRRRAPPLCRSRWLAPMCFSRGDLTSRRKIRAAEPLDQTAPSAFRWSFTCLTTAFPSRSGCHPSARASATNRATSAGVT